MHWLESRRRAWDSKPVVRYLYREEFFRRVREQMVPGGQGLELGSALGHLKEEVPRLITSDVITAPWMDLVCDAHELPFRSGSLRNVVGVDVLHHLEDIPRVFAECERVLEPGGRMVFVEPWITPFARVVWLFHHEECNLRVNPYEQRGRSMPKEPFQGNLALTYLAFHTHRELFEQSLKSLRILHILPFSFLTYVFSFGFMRPNLLPVRLARWMLKLENSTTVLWRRWGAMRALIVIEKRAA